MFNVKTVISYIAIGIALICLINVAFVATSDKTKNAIMESFNVTQNVAKETVNNNDN